MLKATLVPVVLLLAISAAGAPLRAEGWSVWPFGQKASDSRASTAPRRPSKPEPSITDKVTGSVKNSWNSTTKIFTPSKKKPTTTPKPGFSTAAKKKAPEKWSLGGVFGNKKPPEQPRSVTEWMSLPRMDP